MQLLEDLTDGSSMTGCDSELLTVVVCPVAMTSVLVVFRLQAIVLLQTEQLSLVTICNSLRLLRCRICLGQWR